MLRLSNHPIVSDLPVWEGFGISKAKGVASFCGRRLAPVAL